MTEPTPSTETVTTLTPHPAPQLLPAKATLGPVHLDVTDGDRARIFWTRYIGLTELDGDGDDIRLGVDGESLIVLHPNAVTPFAPRHTGLYHVAIHVPARKELARLAARLYALKWEHSPTDHTETVATYTSDPDGNGIEITFETPQRGALAKGRNEYFALLKDGSRRSGTEPLDVDDLLSTLAEDDDILAPMPAGTRIGHVHLHIPDMEQARSFFVDTIGFGDMRYFEEFRMSDFSLETSFVPHALAINTWNGRDASPRPDTSAGLVQWTLRVPEAAALNDIAARIEHSGATFEHDGDVLLVADPAGATLRIEAQAEN